LDSNSALRAAVARRDASANIPPTANREDPICFSKFPHRQRYLFEKLFNKIKRFRRVATRNDKLAESFLAAVKLASIRIWLSDL
jgi:transposase